MAKKTSTKGGKGSKSQAAESNGARLIVGTAAGFRSKHADEDQREGGVKMTPRRVALLKAMRMMKAFDETSAVTVAEVAVRAAKIKGGEEFGDDSEYCGRAHKGNYLASTHLDCYRTAELIHNGLAESCRVEGNKGLSYFLTRKGQNCDLTVEAPAPKAKGEKANGKGGKGSKGSKATTAAKGKGGKAKPKAKATVVTVTQPAEQPTA